MFGHKERSQLELFIFRIAELISEDQVPVRVNRVLDLSCRMDDLASIPSGRLTLAGLLSDDRRLMREAQINLVCGHFCCCAALMLGPPDLALK